MAIKFSESYIDPKLRGKDFYLQMSKAIEYEWRNMDINSFSKGYDRYRTNKKYSNGAQSPQPYMDKFKLQDDPDTSYININWQVPPILPKFRRIALEKIGRYDFSIVAEAIDTQAITLRDEYESKEIANIMLRDMLQAQEMDASVLDSGDMDQPKTREDLMLKMEFTYKHRDAAEMEKRIMAVWRDNKVNEQLRDRMRRTLFDTGVCASRDEYDPQTGRVKVRWVDPSGLGMSPTKDPNFRDCTYFFERIFMTPEEIRAMDPDKEISDEDLEAITDRFSGMRYGRSGYGNYDDEPYAKSNDLSYVPVWDIEFKVMNRTVWEKRLAKDGERIGKIDYSKARLKKGNEYKVDDQYVWLKVKWVEGTDWIFDFGPVPNLKRPFTLKWDAESTFHVVASELQDMETISMVDNLRPIVDAIIFAWYKLQNVIMTARPKGVAIEIGSMEGVQIGTTDLNPMELMDMFDSTGRLWYRRINEDGETTNYKPIEELNNGLGNEAAEWFAIIDRYFNYIRDMLGFNDYTDASTPNPKALASVGAMATANTDNALNHIFRSEREMLRRLAESVAIRIHDILLFGDSNYYSSMLNMDTIADDRRLREGLDRQYGIYIIDSGTEEDKQRLENDMAIALQNGQITIADKEVIRHISNIKQAEMYLAVRVKQNMEEDRRYKMQLQQEAARANAEAGIATENAKAQTIKVEYEQKKELERLKSKLKIEQMKEEARLEAQGYAINSKIDIVRQNTLNNAEAAGVEQQQENQLSNI